MLTSLQNVAPPHVTYCMRTSNVKGIYCLSAAAVGCRDVTVLQLALC
jgi:hypothetical protein